MITNLRCIIGIKIIMSKCFDHKTPIPDTHSKIPPDSHIYASNANVQSRLQAKKSNLEKQMIGLADYAILFVFFECMIMVVM